jgi:hypothetical protein
MRVRGEHVDLHAVRGGELGREGVEPVATPRDEQQVVLVGGEEPGEFGSEPGGRAGDECGGHRRPS